jgi:hypothetical protein
MSPVPGEAGRRVSLRGTLRRAPAGRACPIIGAGSPRPTLRAYAASTSGSTASAAGWRVGWSASSMRRAIVSIVCAYARIALRAPSSPQPAT